jgi:AcrR family transcriptional regulator
MLYINEPAMPVNKEIAREKLILAGERLVAQKGVEGLSLRQVNIEAKQKNTSAALYHFGTRENLLLAIFDYRMEHVDERRHALLEANSSSVRALVHAWVLPDIEEISNAEGGSYHAQFLAVVCNRPDFNVNELWQRPHAGSYKRLADRLRELLPELSAQVFSLRFGMAMLQAIYTMAERERTLESKPKRKNLSTEVFVSHLTDVMEAIFTAPVSPETRALSKNCQ